MIELSFPHKGQKPVVLVLFGASGRGQPASGPVQSLNALIEGLKQDVNFKFAARASLDPSVTASAPKDCWYDAGGQKVFWVSGRRPGPSTLRELLSNPENSLVMLNSFFDREFTLPTLILRKLGLVPRTPLILSPRGEFALGSLSLKSARKRSYLAAVRAVGLLDDVWLHATAEHERADIAATGIRCRGVLQAPNVRFLPEAPSGLDKPRERAGSLRLAYVGRVTPVKNLHYALEVLANVTVPVEYDVFGPISDWDYWANCEARIARLPNQVRVRRMGPLAHDELLSKLTDYDLFFLPTKGENFGHAISEALSVGLPALIADTTPWTELAAANAGWALPLTVPERFAEAIQSFAAKSPEARHAMRLAARRLAEESFAKSDAIEANRRMLLKAMEQQTGA